MEKGLFFNVGISCVGLKICLGYKIHQQKLLKRNVPLETFVYKDIWWRSKQLHPGKQTLQ